MGVTSRQTCQSFLTTHEFILSMYGEIAVPSVVLTNYFLTLTIFHSRSSAVSAVAVLFIGNSNKFNAHIYDSHLISSTFDKKFL